MRANQLYEYCRSILIISPAGIEHESATQIYCILSTVQNNSDSDRNDVASPCAVATSRSFALFVYATIKALSATKSQLS